jgi:restriction system protein
VAVDDMRAFFGVLKSHDLERGIFATSATFTSEASSFASAHGISAQDREGLLKLIATRTPAQQALLLETAYQGEYWRPTCASCGIKMVVREPKSGGPLFWGCTNFAKLRCQSAQMVIRSKRSATPARGETVVQLPKSNVSNQLIVLKNSLGQVLGTFSWVLHPSP